MDWIKNLKIADKLLVFIVVALFFVTVVGVVGYCFTRKANADVAALYQNRLIPIRDLSQMSINSNASNANIIAMMLADTTEKKNNYYNENKERAAQNSTLLKNYEAMNLSSEEKAILADFQVNRKNYAVSREKVAKYCFANKPMLGLDVYRNETKKTFVAYSENLDALIALNTKMAEDIHLQNEKDGTTANAVLLITLLSSFGLLIALGIMISRMITGPITIAVSHLSEGATQVAAASEQLSAASQQLAEGSTEQAAAIQETSASIEESDSMVKQNTDNTQEAAALAKKTKMFAEESNHKMDKMMVSMEELKKSSDDIAKIIKVIDEIAFQTNILALNAAVEAARAGDAGKGFAVVAEEVRNLAQKSAQATKDTAKIIESNVSLSNQSAEMTKEVNTDLKEIDLQAQKVSDLLSEIAIASKEQAQGIEQIDKAIQQMEQVIQANATTAEESASASRELSGQAVNVKEIVYTLQEMVEGQDSMRAKLYR